MIRKIRLWDRLVSGGIIEEFGHKEVETEATTQTAPSMEILGALFDDVRDEPHEVPEEPLSKKVRIQEWNTLLEEAGFAGSPCGSHAPDLDGQKPREG